MAKNSIEVYGASGKTNTLFFRPEALTLIRDPAHPLYDERIHLPLDEGMVRNIMAQGVLEPIIIWKDPETDAVCVVDGRQRVRHTQAANARLQAQGQAPLLIPAVVKRGSAIRMAHAMVSANEIRRADSAIGRAKKMAALRERGHDDADIALLFGCTPSTVHATLQLLEQPAAVQEALESGLITLTHARHLAGLPAAQQRQKVAALCQAGQGVNARTRCQRQREILGLARPRMRSRKEIEAMLAAQSGPFADALRWVLGAALPEAWATAARAASPTPSRRLA